MGSANHFLPALPKRWRAILEDASKWTNACPDKSFLVKHCASYGIKGRRGRWGPAVLGGQVISLPLSHSFLTLPSPLFLCPKLRAVWLTLRNPCWSCRHPSFCIEASAKCWAHLQWGGFHLCGWLHLRVVECCYHLLSPWSSSGSLMRQSHSLSLGWPWPHPFQSQDRQLAPECDCWGCLLMESWASYRKRPNIQFLESRGAGHRASGGLGQSDADHAPHPPGSSSHRCPSQGFPPTPTTEVLGGGDLCQLHGRCQVYSCLQMPWDWEGLRQRLNPAIP